MLALLLTPPTLVIMAPRPGRTVRDPWMAPSVLTRRRRSPVGGAIRLYKLSGFSPKAADGNLRRLTGRFCRRTCRNGNVRPAYRGFGVDDPWGANVPAAAAPFDALDAAFFAACGAWGAAFFAAAVDAFLPFVMVPVAEVSRSR
jgi:hypothetical protein